MSTRTAHTRTWNTMMILWLGLLTGALIVGFFFLYRVMNTVDYQNALLKYSYSTSTKLKAPTGITTTGIIDSGF